jgi:hypothetical protein
MVPDVHQIIPHLSPEFAGEVVELAAIVSSGQPKARTIRCTQTLLWSDAGKTDAEIAA